MSQPPNERRPQTVGELLQLITPRAWVTPALTALIVVGFGVEVALGASPTEPTTAQLLKVGADFGPYVVEGQWWRLVTAMFLHAGVIHLAFNVWAFWSGGKLTERIYGNAAFLAIYLLSGLGASLASLAWHPLTVAVGASGAIFGVYGALLAFVLMHRGVLPRAYLVAQRNGLIGFIGYNVVFALAQKNIDMAAHAGGLFTGFWAGALLSRDLLRPREHVARRVFGVVTLVLLLAVTGFFTRKRINALPEVKAEMAANAALERLKARDLGAAIELYTQALALEKDPGWLVNRGLAHLWQNELERAEEDFRAANDEESTDKTRAFLCQVTAAKGDVEAALARCSDAIAKDPKNSDLFTFRAAAKRTEGHLDEAVADATQALTLDEHNAVARAVRVDARLAQNDLADAEKDCALLVAEKEPRAYDLRLCAAVAWAAKDPALERDRLDKCLTRAPEDKGALGLRAELNQREGRTEEALADYGRLLKVAPDHAAAWNNRAWLYVTLGDYASARADADRAVALAPDSAPELGTRCFALAGVGELERARADCARSIELVPDNPIDLGMLAFLDKRWSDARRHWDAAAARDAENAAALRPWRDKIPR